MTNPRPEPGQVFEHYKAGTHYVVELIAKHTETGEELVVYSNPSNQIWARPLTMFQETVETEEREVPRFKLVENDCWECFWDIGRESSCASSGSLEECIDMVFGYVESEFNFERLTQKAINQRINAIKEECIAKGHARGELWSICRDG